MKLFLFLVCYILLNISVNAQETQVSFDLDGKISVITTEINSKIGLFTEFAFFKEATLFICPDSSYILDILFYTGGKLSRQRKTMAKPEGAAFREKATELLKARNPKALLNHEGRAYLLVSNTLLGLCYYGWAVPLVLELDNEAAYAGYCLSSAASFIVPYALTVNSDVTIASAHLSVYGGVAGIFHGMLLARILDIDNVNGYFGLSLITSITENVIMYNIAAQTEMKAGKADVMANYSTLGAGYGFALDGAFDIFKEGNIWPALPLVGSFGGYIFGNFVANTQDYTSGDATMSFIPVTLSWYLTSSAILAIDEHISMEAYCITNMITTGIGAYIGNELVKGKNFSDNEGNLSILATIAGALVGSGFGALLLADEGSIDKMRYLPLVSCFGGILGYFLTYEGWKDDASDNIYSGSLDFNISPCGLAESLKSSDFFVIDYNTLRPVSIPVLSIKYTF